MSLYGVMNASISGMAAQANLLSTVSDNIANSDTTGYKRAMTAFQSMVDQVSVGEHTAGGVLTRTLYGVSQQGILQGTASVTDLAIQGNGFFAVTDRGGTSYLTRAGAFTPDASGRLVNTAGYYLMGVDLRNGGSNVIANSLAGLSVVSIDGAALNWSPTRAGAFAANLPASAALVAGATPAGNTADAAWTNKTSLLTYDNLGGEKKLDVYYTRTGDNMWEVAVYDKAAASATGFPYSSGPLATTTLNFNAGDGKLAAASPQSISIPIPGGQTLALDLSGMTQLASPYAVNAAVVDGAPPSALTMAQIGSDGVVSYIFADGTKIDAFKIPLADAPSENNLTPVAGNVWSISAESGSVRVGAAGFGGLGVVRSGALERSTADLATELTNMIQAQRGYTANSKVFQTGADLLQVLVNLK
jgi:flagellar hook protein FlgE